MSTEYTPELQELFLEFLVHDPELFVRVNGILESEYFDKPYRKTVDFLKEHSSEYSAQPTLQQIKAVTGLQLNPIEKMDDRHAEWFVDEFEKFCKYKALEAAILKSADLLEKGDGGQVEKIIKDAVQIGLAKHMGTDYWANPAERIEKVRENRGGTSTGWKSIDRKLYGGVNRGELMIFAAASGGGKSLFLQNLALNWAEEGHNVLYVSLELSEELCSMRLDSMLTGMNTKDVFKNVGDVELKVKMKGKKSGALQIVQLKNGINVNDLSAYFRELQIKTDTKFDCVLVDFLDLMMPAGFKVDPSNLFIKDKYVSEELRNFAVEHNLLFATASQLNRAAVEEVEFDHSHISGGLSKIQTADNVIGIFTSQAMRERGRYQIQFMKTRSSSGVGQKVDLAFDVEGLRITDLDEDDDSTPTNQTNAIYDKLKKQTNVTSTKAEEKKSIAENSVVENTLETASRLRSILRKQD